MTWKIFKWGVWIVLATTLIFGGWAIRADYKAQSGILMGLGFVLAGFLLALAAYKNLK